MWKPESVGDVIAERNFVLTKSSGRRARLRVRFGRPVKGKGTFQRDPWWCPIEVKGAGLDSFRSVAGIDSLQALILALELVTRVLPTEAERAGFRIEWLGDSERIVLAKHTLSREVESSLWSMFCTMKDVASILASDEAAERQATRALRAIVGAARTGGNRGRKTTRKRRKPSP